MSLNLDKRQRAMLREMGVRVWQPHAAPLPTLAAKVAVQSSYAEPYAEPLAASTSKARDAVHVNAAPQQVMPAPVQRAPAPQVEERDKRVAMMTPGTSNVGAAWSVGGAMALYLQADPAKGARWLVLAETAAAALQPESFNPFEGDAGKLLDNLLRAVRLHHEGTVMLAPLVRRVVASNSTPDTAAEAALPTLLTTLIAQVQPSVVLVMGRLAAQAVLQSSEPFGKLRGQIHHLHGIKTIVTHDAQYLLRTPSEKAKVWDDLCLALSAVTM